MDDEAARKRAKFILHKYGALGVKAMAVGARDLNASTPWLQREAKEAGVTLLSANLFGTDNTLAFAASTIVEAGGVKVGFIGATAAGPHGDFTAKPALPLIKAEAAKLRGKTDLIVVLAAVTYGDSLQLSNDLKAAVDFIIQSNENRGISMAQKGPGNFVLPSGERGRHVARVDLNLSGKGALSDIGELERNAQVLKILDKQLEEVRRRKALAKEPALKAELAKTEGEFHKRKKQQLAAQGGAKADRTFKLQFVGLGSDVKDDPDWRKEIDRIDPPAGRGH